MPRVVRQTLKLIVDPMDADDIERAICYRRSSGPLPEYDIDMTPVASDRGRVIAEICREWLSTKEVTGG